MAVTLANGITRESNATLYLAPTSDTLGTVEKVFSSGASTTIANEIAATWIIIDSGACASSNPYSFANYGANGYTAASAGNISIHASSTASQLVVIGSNDSVSGSGVAGVLDIQDGKTVTPTGANTLTIGNGAAAAGLVMDGGSATITGGSLAFGSSEALIYANGTNIINSNVTGSGGLTLSGSGTLKLNTASNNGGATVVDSGTLELNVVNALADNSNVTLEDVKTHPSAAILQLAANNTFSSPNSVGSDSSVLRGTGIALTIGDGNNLSSTLSSTITDSGAASGKAGALTKSGSGLLDLFRRRQERHCPERGQHDRDEWRATADWHQHHRERQRNRIGWRHRV